MFVEQLYTKCLSEAAYYLSSNGEAAVIDPLRDVAQYLEIAKARGDKIKFIFETHFHADFVSGHLDLAEKTGAKIIFGPTAKTQYPIHLGKDHEIFQLGEITLTLLHTPGHTLESSCFLLKDKKGKDKFLFTGDTLFIGDVGRPDLLDGKMTKEELASLLYDSLNKKIKVLPEDIIIYPGHGAGSACGKNISQETFSTLSQQKRFNYALQDLSREEFIHQVTEGLSQPPAYFYKDATMNKQGYDSLDQLLISTHEQTSVEKFNALWQAGMEILDTRPPEVFEKGYIPGSLNVGINGEFAPWVGQLLDPQKPFLLVLQDGKEKETLTRLARIGYDNIHGHLVGLHAWKAINFPLEKADSIAADEFATRFFSKDANDRQSQASSGKILDVRKPNELENGRVQGSTHHCLSDLKHRLPELDKHKAWHVHCAGGYRSMMALSLMKKAGFEQVIHIQGGFATIKETESIKKHIL